MKYIGKIALIIFLLFFIKIYTFSQIMSMTKISLNEQWKVRPMRPLVSPEKADNQRFSTVTEGVVVNIPNTAMGALMDKGIIENPFYRANEKKLQWLEQEDWVFEKTFQLTADFLKNEHQTLIFKGLDTYAKVYLNGKEILEADNMFRTWSADVRRYLQNGTNTLRIDFTSPLKIEASKIKKLGFNLPDGTRMFTRKAQFHYGWDWGPRFVTVGISESVMLEGWSDAKIDDVNIQQNFLSDSIAQMEVHLHLLKRNFGKNKIVLSVDNQTIERNITGLNDDIKIAVPFNILKPRRWWTRALGEPYLYTLRVELYTEGGVLLDVTSKRFGLRTIELVREKDKVGETFFFRLNGIPIFAKGANYIPLHFFQEKVQKADYQRMIDDALAANMNMLRVWGGGIYERDEFYELCDEKGLLVWQDFMFACAMYPWDDAFLKNVEAEAKEQIVRLRNHASVAVWCGNNEIREAWHNWGWNIRYFGRKGRRIWKGYEALFEKMLPELVKEYAPHTPYHESSPMYSRFNVKALKESDAHYWGVWHDAEPFEIFDEKVPRFMSEFGFQSFPHWRTLESVTLPEDRALESEVMLIHQKHPKGNTLIKKYLDEYYREPDSFKNFVYVSQLLQAEGMKRGIEAQRRAMPYCMGSLYWQLNDVWQVASWAGIDFEGRWKALHYYAKDAFAEILISTEEEKDSLNIYLVSDLVGDTEGVLRTSVMTFSGDTLLQDTQKITLRKLYSDVYKKYKITDLLKNQDKRNVVVALSFEQSNQRVEKLHYFVKAKKMNLTVPEIAVKVLPTEGGANIELTAKSLAKNVFLDIDKTLLNSSEKEILNLENNFFDMLPKKVYRIFYPLKNVDIQSLEKALKVVSLIDTYSKK
jgi:beta-mannosidase